MTAEPARAARPTLRLRRQGGGLLPVGPLRLGWIGWAELTVAAVIIALLWRPADWYLAAGVAAAGLLLAVPIRNRSALGWAAVGVRFLTRRRHGMVTADRPAPAAPTRSRRSVAVSPVARTGPALPRGAGGVVVRSAAPAVPRSTDLAVPDAVEAGPTGALLSTLAPGLSVTATTSADGSPIGVVGLDGRWIVVLTLRSDQQLVARVGETDTVPLHVAVPLLDTAGIRLDSIQLVVLNSPGSSALPEQSPALTSHLELLGGLPTAARRRVLVAVRMDPLVSPRAIDARGGGMDGIRRAMAASAARAVAAFGEAGFEMRTLNAAETATAIASVSGLPRPDGPGVPWADRWSSLDVGPLSHRSYAVTRWAGRAGQNPLDQLGNIRARAVSTSINLAGTAHRPVLTATVRITAAGRDELGAAQGQLLRTARLVHLGLAPADGYQREAFVAGLPLGGPQGSR